MSDSEESDQKDALLLQHRPSMSRKENAMAIWKGYAAAPDRLLESLYQYYRGGGFQTLLLSKSANLLMFAFLHFFVLYLLYGVDWSVLTVHHEQVQWRQYFCASPWCLLRKMSLIGWLLSMICMLCWCWVAAQLWLVDRVRWGEAKTIFNHLLDLRDRQLARVDYDSVMKKIIAVNNEHSLIKGLDELQICSRLMRRENYLIALFNKGLLDFRIGQDSESEQHGGRTGLKIPLSKPLECALTFAILGYIFDERFVIHQRFVGRQSGSADKQTLTEGLRRRMLLTGIFSILLSPLVFLLTLCYLIFRYGEESYRHPQSITTRQYNLTARWMLREYNELPHYFERRLNATTKKAGKYVEQFHSSRLAALARLVSFVAGSLFLLLAYLYLRNEDLLLHLQLPFGKSIIWYLGLLTAILAISRGMQPDESQRDDPARLLLQIIDYLHYRPSSWTDLNSARCFHDFGKLYQYKVRVLVDDLLGTIFTPLILLFVLPDRVESLIDFFREFTVHVDGLGYVCSFSLFNFSTSASALKGDERDVDDNKMCISMASFAERHFAKDCSLSSLTESTDRQEVKNNPAATTTTSILNQFYK